jgi:hypothetical protein
MYFRSCISYFNMYPLLILYFIPSINIVLHALH